MSAARGNHGEHGAIVIEAMIAAAIVAAMCAAAFEAVTATSRTSRALEARREAMLVAQSTLATVGVAIPVVPGATDGIAGSLTWRVDIVPTASGESAAGTLDRVTVTVRAANKRAPLATLSTLRLAR